MLLLLSLLLFHPEKIFFLLWNPFLFDIFGLHLFFLLLSEMESLLGYDSDDALSSSSTNTNNSHSSLSSETISTSTSTFPSSALNSTTTKKRKDGQGKVVLTLPISVTAIRQFKEEEERETSQIVGEKKKFATFSSTLPPPTYSGELKKKAREEKCSEFGKSQKLSKKSLNRSRKKDRKSEIKSHGADEDSIPSPPRPPSPISFGIFGERKEWRANRDYTAKTNKKPKPIEKKCNKALQLQKKQDEFNGQHLEEGDQESRDRNVSHEGENELKKNEDIFAGKIASSSEAKEIYIQLQHFGNSHKESKSQSHDYLSQSQEPQCQSKEVHIQAKEQEQEQEQQQDEEQQQERQQQQQQQQQQNQQKPPLDALSQQNSLPKKKSRKDHLREKLLSTPSLPSSLTQAQAQPTFNSTIPHPFIPPQEGTFPPCYAFMQGIPPHPTSLSAISPFPPSSVTDSFVPNSGMGAGVNGVTSAFVERGDFRNTTETSGSFFNVQSYFESVFFYFLMGKYLGHVG